MADHPSLAWGLIGASDIAETRMIPALRREGHRILRVASRSADHAREFSVRNEIPPTESDFSLETLLEDPAVDAVYISSTNEQHLAHAAAAAAAGKHVLCEKPVSTDLDSAQKIVAACADHGVVLAVNHHLPAAGTHRAIRKLVHDGAIGRVLSVNVRHTSLLPERLRGWRLSAAPGAGVVMDLTGHDASVVNPLLGTRALEATAITVRQGRWESAADDAAASVLLYEDDVLVRFHDAFTTPYTPSYLEVHGELGSIHAPEVMTPEPIGSVFLRDSGGEREIDVPDRRHPYDITLDHFTRAVHGDGRPVVDGRDAVNALRVCLAILESAETGRRVSLNQEPNPRAITSR
ncbi:oxidoreductase domain-containing protein [Mycolicibacterium mageritense DSM 44476 = CIP 104973]|nr:Gfo/Idh/MocA family oxidoreductase [Mycolicibacterium mageritense]MCC9184428.1 Gfo/Idh/MocA family oxidoreductase [Mycolicibacterium mageritense]CDO22541.1 oxidoreductase domain-containing protein [Mycolicibacterium mageritense DSM 44476 = CIP 104973]